MAKAIRHDEAVALEDFIRNDYPNFVSQMYLESSTIKNFMMIDGIKDQLTVTEMLVDNVWQAKTDGWNPLEVVGYNPRTLKVGAIKSDFVITPDRYETANRSYLGRLRQKGQNPHDWPRQAMHMENITAKGVEQIEYALWNAEKAGVVNTGDPITVMFDGGHKIIRDAIADVNVPFNEIATGAITQANVIASIEAMADSLDKAVKKKGFTIYANENIRTLYYRAVRATHGGTAFEFGTNGEFKLLGMNAKWVSLDGMKDNAIIMMPEGNGLFGTDDLYDQTNFRSQPFRRDIEFMADAKIGIDFMILVDGYVAVNDQH